MFHIFSKDINIGLNTQMSKTNRHGIAWVRTMEGGIVQQSFLADKPEHLVNPNRFTIEKIFKQLRKLGMDPVHLEILVGDVCRVYKAGYFKPILVQSI